ncbi:hypothetical protein M0813_09268 [Anaeramoeba flamelloides]|uniref:Stealth protein CR2 conserved region 2 domain-containing protein n=1 Tax=Anaeramoeba flamelloides TaxID=1746091 RepID=A0AAV7Y5N1_9EUKA|nr:hypothetical protein M0812_29044 [Anaeramoeba flamelloides]KAJ6227855.1 hypothetical protein M0813_09268 [Anaeramoeba flamelloides]
MADLKKMKNNGRGYRSKEFLKRKKNIAKELKKMKNYKLKQTNKIDLVYTWGGVMNEMNQRNRYNYELQYSLRSAYKYLPWLNKIYILINSDTQYPYWLKEDLDKIVVVDRCTLFTNPSNCPTYNTFAVFAVAHRIPDLSNKFILIDDDVFFNRPLSPDYFFTENGLPAVYEARIPMLVYPDNEYKDFDFPEMKWAKCSHKAKPMRKDLIKKFNELYLGYSEHVQSHKYRYKGLSEELSMIYYEFLNQNTFIESRPHQEAEFLQILHSHPDDIQQEFEDIYDALQSKQFKTFNCNDDFSTEEDVYQKQRKVLWNFFNKLYPQAPSFEKINPDHEWYS